MTRSSRNVDGLSATDAKVLKDIEVFGWHTTGVFPTKDDDGDSNWAFSIGLFHTFGHPEVILFGLPLERCTGIVNEIGKQVKSGQRYEPERIVEDVLRAPYQCMFKEVLPSQYHDHVGYALWFYETDPFPLLQCFWPDKEGHFPWDKACNTYVKASQPLLYLP
jgi:hypothetical protein